MYLSRWLLLATILTGALPSAVWGQSTTTLPKPATTLPRVVVWLGKHSFEVSVATGFRSRAYGLMNRTRLSRTHGMLFVFRDSAPRTFWMKDTHVALDILFFNDKHQLVSMQSNAQPCTKTPCKLYPSRVPARYVLELAAGTAQRLDTRIGQHLRIVGSLGPIQ